MREVAGCEHNRVGRRRLVAAAMAERGSHAIGGPVTVLRLLRPFYAPKKCP